MLTKRELAKATLMVPTMGGDVTVVYEETGEVVFTLGLLAGITKGRDLLEYIGQDQLLQLGEGITAMMPNAQRVMAQPYGEGAMSTAANPDFIPHGGQEARIAYLERMVQAVAQNAQGLQKANANMQRRIDAQAQRDADQKAEAEAKAKAQAEAKAKVEADSKAKTETEAKAEAEAVVE